LSRKVRRLQSIGNEPPEKGLFAPPWKPDRSSGGFYFSEEQEMAMNPDAVKRILTEAGKAERIIIGVILYFYAIFHPRILVGILLNYVEMLAVLPQVDAINKSIEKLYVLVKDGKKRTEKSEGGIAR
jgi:hypothetical protein